MISAIWGNNQSHPIHSYVKCNVSHWKEEIHTDSSILVWHTLYYSTEDVCTVYSKFLRKNRGLHFCRIKCETLWQESTTMSSPETIFPLERVMVSFLQYDHNLHDIPSVPCYSKITFIHFLVFTVIN